MQPDDDARPDAESAAEAGEPGSGSIDEPVDGDEPVGGSELDPALAAEPPAQPASPSRYRLRAALRSIRSGGARTVVRSRASVVRLAARGGAAASWVWSSSARGVVRFGASVVRLAARGGAAASWVWSSSSRGVARFGASVVRLVARGGAAAASVVSSSARRLGRLGASVARLAAGGAAVAVHGAGAPARWLAGARRAWRARALGRAALRAEARATARAEARAAGAEQPAPSIDLADPAPQPQVVDADGLADDVATPREAVAEEPSAARGTATSDPVAPDDPTDAAKEAPDSAEQRAPVGSVWRRRVSGLVAGAAVTVRGVVRRSDTGRDVMPGEAPFPAQDEVRVESAEPPTSSGDAPEAVADSRGTAGDEDARSASSSGDLPGTGQPAPGASSHVPGPPTPWRAGKQPPRSETKPETKPETRSETSSETSRDQSPDKTPDQSPDTRPDRRPEPASVPAGRLASRQRSQHERAMRQQDKRRAQRRRRITRLLSQDRARRARRRRVLLALVISPLLVAVGLTAAAYYVDTIPAPADLTLPEATTVYYADGTTPMARLGSENRTILGFDDMNAAVKQSIVAAEDRAFWSTITQQYVRTAAGLKGVTFARKTREAMLAWKMDRSYSKDKILEFYLNTVPFGRGAYGVEAAAQAYFGKTTRRTAPESQQVTVAEAMVLASVVKQPEPDPADPNGNPGYDPARGGKAAANALLRWQYVRDGMVALGYLTGAQAAAMQYPHTVRPLDLSVPDNGLNSPTGLVVNHVLSELRTSQPFAGQAPDYIRNGGFRIVTTVDSRAQAVAEAAADIRRPTAPPVDQGQPANWQAALVAIEPGTGRVLAYYGGNDGTGADFAGWYYDANGEAHGYGEHPPGSSFKVYDLAEALRQGISLSSHWDSPAVKEFPNSGRTNASPTGPVRNSSSASCQPDCTLIQATVASLNVPFFDLTEKLGPTNVLDMASKAGIDSMWTDATGQQAPVRVDLRPASGTDNDAAANKNAPTAKSFSTEVGIGQYGVTVLDHANGMATFAAGGERAQAHFVRAVYRHGDLVYAEQLTQSPVGLTPAQVDELTSVLAQVPSAKLPDGWDAAGKTGTWQAGNSSTQNAHVWMVGYTRALAVAVWVGTTDGKALKTRDGRSDVFGSTHAAPIWSQFLVGATAAMNLEPRQRNFPAANVVSTPSPSPSGQ
jgi:membrane peptidoglycan carboxypeptidase